MDGRTEERITGNGIAHQYRCLGIDCQLHIVHSIFHIKRRPIEIQLSDIREISNAQKLCQLRANLPGLAVNGAFAAEDHIVVFSRLLLLVFHRCRQHRSGGKGIGAAKGGIGQKDAAVSTHQPGRSQNLLGLGCAHGNDSDLTAI